MLLLYWLMRRMSAARMTTRFVIAPLMANLIAMALFRPPFDVRTDLGLLLIVSGAGWLLFAHDEETETRRGPLNLKLD
jgi:drug/metabolite transporter (DMT)-like permease